MVGLLQDIEREKAARLELEKTVLEQNKIARTKSTTENGKVTISVE